MASERAFSAPLEFDIWRSAYILTRRIPKVRTWVERVLPDRGMRVGDAQFKLSPKDNRCEKLTWLHGYPPEKQSMQKLIDEVSKGPCLFIDIGANAGLYSVLGARAMAPGSTCLSVEPNPVMVARLNHNLELNGLQDRVTILQAALGAHVGTATLSVHARNLGQSSLNPVPAAQTARQIEVSTKPLSDVIAQYHEGRRVVIKIDIEGYEDTVLMPFFDGEPDLLPECLLIETQYSDGWKQDLLGAIAKAGYLPLFEGEGNTLFTSVS